MHAPKAPFLRILACSLLLGSLLSAAEAGAAFSLEFREARLGQVLDYLSEQAGFVIADPIELEQSITLVARQQLTPEQAVAALNTVLFDRGYAAILRGKTLRVIPLPQARLQNLPVSLGGRVEDIPDDQQIVTHIIPVQHATAKDLLENITPLIDAGSTSLSANEATNTLIITAARSDVRRVVGIVAAIDRSVSGEQQVQVFHLAHAEASSVAKIIDEIYSDDDKQAANNNNNTRWSRRGQQQAQESGDAQARGFDVVATADEGTNSIVVRAGLAVMPVIEEMVAQLDQDTWSQDAVLVYQVRNGKATDIADSLTQLFQGTNTSSTTRQNRQPGNNQQGTAATGIDLSSDVRVVANEDSNSVLLLSPERNFARLQQILETLDQPRRQVLVRVLVAEVTIADGLDIGVEMEYLDHNRAGNSVNSDFNIFDSTMGMSGFLLNGTDFRATLRALSSQTNFDVLSRPYIVTSDNQQAVVNVSQEVAIINGSRTDSDNNITTTFDRRDVGIILTITPQINSEGLVVLDVNQELSALADQGIPVADGFEAPIINKRTMTTRVGVESGQTVVIGGLVQDTMTEVKRKVPFLGDIPLLGLLFSRTERTKAQTELMIFLTPQVINSPEDLRNMSEQLRAEIKLLNAAVAQGLLQAHLDRLQKLELGEALPPRQLPANNNDDEDEDEGEML